MILAFEFKVAFASSEFCYLLEFFSQNLEHKLVTDDKTITLYVSGDEYELSDFADTLSQNMPHSIYLQSSNVYLTDKENFKNFKTSSPYSAVSANITPSVINEYLKSKKVIKNEFSALSNVCIYNENVNEQNFSKILSKSVSDFLEKKSINLKLNGAELTLFTMDNELKFEILMPTNLKNLPKIFIADERSQVAIASFEKPLLSLKTNALFRQKHKNASKFYDVMAPNDIFIYAFCSELLKYGINFICINAKNLEHKRAILLDGKILVANTDVKIEKIEPNFTLNFTKNENDSINFSTKNSEVPLLFVPNFSSFDEIYKSIKELKNGDEFLINFEKQHKLAYADINLKANFFSLLCIVGVILGFDKDYTKAGEKLLQNAADFSVKKGVSIECVCEKNEFNAVKFIKSAMSFYLAGAGVHNISFGCIESLAYFFSEFLYKFRDELGSNDVYFSGDLFKNSVISNLLFKHINPNLNAHFKDFLEV